METIKIATPVKAIKDNVRVLHEIEDGTKVVTTASRAFAEAVINEVGFDYKQGNEFDIVLKEGGFWFSSPDFEPAPKKVAHAKDKN